MFICVFWFLCECFHFVKSFTLRICHLATKVSSDFYYFFIFLLIMDQRVAFKALIAEIVLHCS